MTIADSVSRAEYQSALNNWCSVASGLRDLGDLCAAERDAALAEVTRLREALAEAVRGDCR